ncbi:hypothetical protein DFH06DRAFT_1134326 [Mycena polygramma]|nr:hypothetical protein DFH06DRAFT_1134326 [Mycena polygramma]
MRALDKQTRVSTHLVPTDTGVKVKRRVQHQPTKRIEGNSPSMATKQEMGGYSIRFRTRYGTTDSTEIKMQFYIWLSALERMRPRERRAYIGVIEIYATGAASIAGAGAGVGAERGLGGLVVQSRRM